MDESKQLQNITEIFWDEWKRFDFGPGIMAEYIHFCEYKPEILPTFFKTVNLTIR
jgi:hypothetical protein